MSEAVEELRKDFESYQSTLKELEADLHALLQDRATRAQTATTEIASIADVLRRVHQMSNRFLMLGLRLDELRDVVERVEETK